MAKKPPLYCYEKVSQPLFERLEARVTAGPRTVNPNADYAAAAQDMIAELKKNVLAVQTAMAEAAKAAAAPKTETKTEAPAETPKQEVPAPAQQVLETAVADLPKEQQDALEDHYGEMQDTPEFWQKLSADVVKYVNKGAKAVDSAIRSIIKAVSEGVLAMGLIFNPAVNPTNFSFNLPAIHASVQNQTVGVRAAVPLDAIEKMSGTAQEVYQTMAPTAKATGKGFMIADKPNGMLHVFDSNGDVLAQEPALYGKDTGDKLESKSSLEGGAKITPAGSFTLEYAPNAEYAGGHIFRLKESYDGTGYIAVHSVYLGDPKENRQGRLDSETADDNRISYGCVNTTKETFVEKIMPQSDKLDGGMVFVLPDNENLVAEMFPAQTKTTETTQPEGSAQGQRLAQGALGKNENEGRMSIGRGRKNGKGSTREQVLNELRGFMPLQSSKLKVLHSASYLPADAKAAYDAKVAEAGGKKAGGMVYGDVAYLFADGIQPGETRAVFMHEVGGHLGFDEALSPGEKVDLYQQIDRWARKADGSIEHQAAKSAMERANAAGITDTMEHVSETMAYFLEEATLRGVNPQAAAAAQGALGDWFRKVMQAAARVFKQFFGEHGSVRGLTAQDIVDMAYGISANVLKESPQVKARAPLSKVSDALKPAAKAKMSIARPVSDAARRVGGASSAMLAEDATHWTKKLANSLMFLHDIVDKYKNSVPAIGKWYAAVQESIAQRNRYEKEAEKIADMADKLEGGTERVNDFISRSTFEQKWGYIPSWKPGVTVDPAMQAAYKQLTNKEKEVVHAVFAHGEKMRKERESILKAMGIKDKILETYSKLEGPYAPLKRFGNYVAVLKSQALRDAEKAKDNALVEKLKADPTHYVVSYFDTKGQARQFAWENDKKNGGAFEFTDDFEKSERPMEGRVVPEKVLQDLLAAMKLDQNIDPKAHAAATQMVQNMMLQYMDEHNARLQGLRRRNRAGYDKDMIRSFLSHARAEANFLSNIQNGEKISMAYQEMHDQAKDKPSGQRLHQDAVNAVAAHYADMLNYKETPWQDRAMAMTSAWQLATSVGYHLTNFMQGVMVSLPKLAADFNDYSGAWHHLLNGYRLMGKAGVGNKFDINKVSNQGLREALQLAMDMGVLDVGMNEDLSHFEASRTGIDGVDKTTKVARSALHKLNQIARGVEIMNRVSAATAAYNMALSKGKSQADAKLYALRTLQSTQGDFSRAGSPLLLKKLPKIMTQYKKYQFMMAALYAKAFNQAFFDADPKERAIGRRMLTYKLAHTGIAAGALGLPLMNLVSMVFGALGGDDEPPDLERSLREWIGDETMANLLLHGPLAAAGLDMSAKLGDDKIFSIMPYGEWDFSSASGFGKTVMSLAGPAASQMGKFADGVGFMQRGDYYKGVEKFMPKGVADGMKAFRVANEGFTLKNGDLMFKPEDINGFVLALDALGLPSSEMKRMEWLKGQQYEIGQFYQQRSKAVQKEYADAFEARDSEAMAQARQDWMDLQAGKNRLRYLFNDSNDALKVQPLSTLLRYPQTQAKREQKLQRAAGVTG